MKGDKEETSTKRRSGELGVSRREVNEEPTQVTEKEQLVNQKDQDRERKPPRKPRQESAS